MRVGFQGERGAYSEVALRSYFPEEETEAIGFKLSEEVVEALLSENISMAILPLENSIVGNVNINMDLIYQNPLFAIGEVYLPIHHHLLAYPGTKYKDITHVYSHPIALAQCRNFINKNQMIPIPDYDTAGSCKLLKERVSQNISQKNSSSLQITEAAIGSSLCSEVYGLEILSDQIQQTSHNITRFLILVHKDKIPKSPFLLQRESRTKEKIKIKTRTKTSIAFSAHHRPGALLDCLQIFKKYAINMTKLESRPIPEDPFQYIFFVDFLGNIKDTKIGECLKELNRDAHHVKILGSYPSTQTLP